MPEIASKVMRAAQLQTRLGHVFWHRTSHAWEHYMDRSRAAFTSVTAQSAVAGQPLLAWHEYTLDFMQRGVLFWDTLRRRGNQYLEHEIAGKPPVLHFESELVFDGRHFERPVNYALLRILPPAGVTTDPKRRPYVMIDPRAGHGPGIGGFKDDSQVGVALRGGHPVYFVSFFPKPERGQTIVDVCIAEQKFLHRVVELHPESPKPVLVGNCQGGWAAMMIAASNPEETGPIVISGAPMSYWGGAWSEGEGNNPMRYAGGMLGGTWLASLMADLGDGLFDGAYLVQNFENLNPANTYWDKYYNVFAKADTEPPRFLDFERWWGGYYLLNRAEIEWMTQNLFVGNDLWTGGVKIKGDALDLREVQSPMIIFASLGDNITPPQQAFNWVADVYHSTEEIKARGQVIVGLLHQKAGHLALFVSGKVAKKEHTQIAAVLESIEALPPGLYGMKINEQRNNGKVEYEVEFLEHRLEDLAAKLNRVQRIDEKPFEAVAQVSQFNQTAYEIFARPFVSALANPVSAWVGRMLHPLRVEHWGISDLNPLCWWLGPAARAVQAERTPAAADNPFRKVEAAVSELVSGSLEWYRDYRDALTEASFFSIYGHLFFRLGEDTANAGVSGISARDPRSLPLLAAALSGLESGGYAAALARTAELLERSGAPVPLARIERKAALMKEYSELLPDISEREWKLTRGQQDTIVRFEPERALSTLPHLLADPSDRERFLNVLERVANDREFTGEPTHEQREMLDRIRQLVRNPDNTVRRPAA